MAAFSGEPGLVGRPAVEVRGLRLSWGAIFAGLVVATVLQIVLSLLGVAIGLAAWDPGDAAKGLGIGAAIWTALSGILSLFIGGRTAGRLAGILRRKDGALHGVVLWGLSTILTVWLLASGAGALLGSALSIVGRTAAATAGGIASGVGQVGAAAVGQVGGLDLGSIQREVESALRQTGDPTLRPDSLKAAAGRAGDQATSDATNQELAGEIATMVVSRAGQIDRQDLVNLIAARTDLSRAEAERLATRVENAVQTVTSRVSGAMDTLGAKAQAAAGEATDAIAEGAWWALLMLGLGVAAAAGGAAMTARE